MCSMNGSVRLHANPIGKSFARSLLIWPNVGYVAPSGPPYSASAIVSVLGER
jgi:hypothetical protein